MRGLPLRTNGGFTTRALSSLPRMSTWTCSPVPAGTRAKRDGALERRREGAAGDFAFADAGDDDFLMAAQHAAVFEQQADELARRCRAP